jgi:hypothetical protein
MDEVRPLARAGCITGIMTVMKQRQAWIELGRMRFTYSNKLALEGRATLSRLMAGMLHRLYYQDQTKGPRHGGGALPKMIPA